MTMTDKQIIIDGVDVSGCCFYNSNGECCTSRVWEGYCKDCRKCMYKLDQQLKAKEQELEQYKRSKQASYELLQQECNKVVLENRRLKAENDELKNFHINLVGVKECEIKELVKLKAENDKLKESLDAFIKVQYQLADNNKKLRQCLTEIKEIANKFDYWNSNLSQASEILHEIIEKISEVEDE